MDDQRFDEVARGLATGISRRTLLRLFGVGGAGFLGSGGALARLRSDVVAAPPPDACQTQLGGHCTTAIPCCHGICDDDGRCGCLPGKVPCDGACVAPVAFESDAANCGACGKVCDGRCVGGSCEQAPPPEETEPRCALNEPPCGDRCCPVWMSCVEGECRACPPETDCLHTGFARCGAYTTERLCCPAPAVAACCCDSAPGAGDGWAGCCIDEGPDADCPPCVYRGVYVGDGVSCRGGPGDCCGPNASFPECCYQRECPGGNCVTDCPA